MIKSTKLALLFSASLYCFSVIENANAQSTFLLTMGASGTASWNLAANWDTGMVPNGIDVSVFFPSLTALESVTLDGPKTVGSLTLTNDSAFVWTLANGTPSGGPLTFDVSTGDASLTINGVGTVANVLSATIVLSDTLNVTINNTVGNVTTGALQLSGGMSGSGGFIKNGAGRVSFATTAKTYTGATIINAGILRTSLAGIANATSSVTVNSGGQLLLAPTSAGQTLLFGANPAVVVTLNGDGPTAGSGALGGSGNSTTLSNAINLASSSTINAATALTLSGPIGGVGALTKTGTNTLTLSAANSYAGGTIHTAGTLIAGADGALGTGNVSLTASGITLTLQNGATNNYISDNATISIVSGAIANLNYTGTDVVGGIVLNGVPQLMFGTYGSPASGADFQSADFLGMGTLTLIPEPATYMLLGFGFLVCAQQFRRKKN